MYVRMLVIMCISLYTSRIILKELGATDFGIYNVVGGVITMMAFINASLSASTSRNLTHALGTKDDALLKKTFSASLNLHLIVALICVIVGETIGLWFVLNKLTIPAERMDAALWVYQISIITTCVQITQIPYSSSLISHEDLSIYAYAGLCEAFNKLIIVWLISITSHDKLILFALLSMANTVGLLLFYRFYTLRKYAECRFMFVWDKDLYKSLTSYSGWNLLGGISVICQGQGINILLNIFFGPSINAARALALQIQTAVFNFVTNFLVAVRPQVIKSHAQGDIAKMYSMTFHTGKYAFYLMLLLTIPFLFEMDFILGLWLVDTPAYTRIFAIITLLIGLVHTLQETIYMPFHAIGVMKSGNIASCIVMTGSLVLTYALLKTGIDPYWVLIISMISLCILHIAYVFIIHKNQPFKYPDLIKTLYIPISIVFILSIIIPSFICHLLPQGWPRFILNLIISEITTIGIIWFIGLNCHEKGLIIHFTKTKLHIKHET